LLESELFGYEEGSFAGARKGGKPGKFELAHRGTLFLDEIGDMSPAVQTKLFRAIQEKEVERIGRTRSIRTDVRIIAATNQDLEKGVVEKNNSASFLFFSHTPVWNNNTFFSGSSQK
jgi:transcriptional regulator with PAS, ATPase and Fis domain